jgi:GAF domain-containing protein
VAATLIKIAELDLPYGLVSIIALQMTEPVLWLIDLLPFFLGLLAFLFGQRQATLKQIRAEQMARIIELENSKANLQNSIVEYAQKLVVLNQRTSTQVEQLRLIADVARWAISVQDVERLLPQLAHLIGQRFNFYHVGIFLLDEQKQYAVLRASNSAGGLRMIKTGHRLKVGAQGIVGYVSQTGQARIAPNVQADPAYFGEIDLLETRSEIAVPLKSGDVILGVLDIQSTDPNGFSEEDSSTLAILADQVTIAIQNALSHERSQRALIEAETTSRQATRRAWMAYRKRLGRRGYRYDGVKSEPLKERGTADGSGSILNLAVRLRSQTLGHLQLRHRDPLHTWTEDERSLAEATAERVALAIEGARLLEEAQNRASRETFLSDITARLGASFQMDSILRDTVEELGQVFQQSSVTFQLVNPSRSTGLIKNNPNGSSGHEQKEE